MYTTRLLFILLACLPFLSGCPEANGPGSTGNLSLVEIGERSFESGERFEGSGRIGEAAEEYRRALWAFRYHQHLTGERPLLMDEVVEASRRVAGRR